MREIPYYIRLDKIRSLPLHNIPGYPDFEWLRDGSLASQITETIEMAVPPNGIQLAAYCLPWNVAGHEFQYYAHLNPKWNLLDLIGGRYHSLFEWPGDGYEAVQREASEEVHLHDQLFKTDLNSSPMLWLLNTEGNSFGPIYRPLVLGTIGKLIPIPPSSLTTLNETNTTRRLLAVLSIIDNNPNIQRSLP